jgi:hypothetical protein
MQKMGIQPAIPPQINIENVGMQNAVQPPQPQAIIIENKIN